MSRYEVVPLPTDVEVEPGADLTALLLDACRAAGIQLADGDVLCVASKVVAKAEGAFVPLPPGDHHAARRTLARQQARRVVADAPFVLVVETHHGFVCANAGIDTSNVAAADVALLLPDAPDASAASLRAAVRDRVGVDVGVLVTDTFGRPWRLGQTDVALGAAGVAVLRDERGTTDRVGRQLDVTMVAVGDQLAAAADLARSKSDGAPFVLVRGLTAAIDAGAATASGADLVRPADQDLFHEGGATAVLGALARTATTTVSPTRGVPDDVRDRLAAVAVDAARVLGGTVTVTSDDAPTGTVLALAGAPASVGAAVHAVAVAATAMGWTVHHRPADDGTALVVVGEP